MANKSVVATADNATSSLRSGRIFPTVPHFKRLGKAEGITVTAHKLARIIYGMIVSGKPYYEVEAFKLSPAY